MPVTHMFSLENAATGCLGCDSRPFSGSAGWQDWHWEVSNFDTDRDEPVGLPGVRPYVGLLPLRLFGALLIWNRISRRESHGLRSAFMLALLAQQMAPAHRRTLNLSSRDDSSGCVAGRRQAVPVRV